MAGVKGGGGQILLHLLHFLQYIPPFWTLTIPTELIYKGEGSNSSYISYISYNISRRFEQ